MDWFLATYRSLREAFRRLETAGAGNSASPEVGMAVPVKPPAKPLAPLHPPRSLPETQMTRPCMRIVLLAAVTLAAAAAAPSAALADTACPQPDATLASLSDVDINFVTICLVNEQRAAVGAPPVTFNLQLFQAGSAHAADMVAKSYFSHTSASGTDPESRALSAGYANADDLLGLGEVLAWGSGTQATPREIVNSWMASSTHRATMLDPYYREAGFGIVAGAPVADGGSGAATYAGEFGRRAAGSTPTAEAAGSESTTATTTSSSTTRTRVVTKKRCRWVKRTGHRRTKTCRKVRVRVHI